MVIEFESWYARCVLCFFGLLGKTTRPGHHVYRLIYSAYTLETPNAQSTMLRPLRYIQRISGLKYFNVNIANKPHSPLSQNVAHIQDFVLPRL